MDLDEMWMWAERHHGLLRNDELSSAGLSHGRRRRMVGADLERWSARVLHRVGAPVTEHTHMLAAVLDAGTGVAAGGAASAWLWQAPGFRTLERPVELARQRGQSKLRRSSLGVVVERRWLPAHHTTEVAGIPTLTLPVLLFQLAGRMRPERFERLADTIAGRSPAVLRALHDLLPEMAERGRNGITAMRAYLDLRPPGVRRPTGLERRAREFLEEAGIHLDAEADLGGHEWLGRVDLYDRSLQLIVEINSATYHDSFLDRQHDERRAQALLDAGFRGVLQVHEDVVWYRPSDLVTSVRSAQEVLQGRSVIANVPPGVTFAMTKREDGEPA